MKALIAICLMYALLLGAAVDAPAPEETEAETERGSLEINASVIHDTRDVTNEQQRFIGHEVAPHLFLREKTQLEYRRRQENREHIRRVQEQLFLDKDIDSRVSDFDKQAVLPLLFAEGSLESLRTTALPQYLEAMRMPTWMIALFAVLGLSVVTWGGITLGRHFSHLLHGKKLTYEE